MSAPSPCATGCSPRVWSGPHPAFSHKRHRLAARLLANGPLVDGCRAAVLFAGPFWHGLPATARLLFALLPLGVIALLAVAWRGAYDGIGPATRVAVGLIVASSPAMLRRS